MTDASDKQVADQGEMSEVIGIALLHIKSMSNILDDLLDVARFESGKMIIKKATIDLCEVVDDAIAGLKASATNKNIQFSLSTPKKPVVINGDRLRLIQVVANLLSNACKYTPSGGHIWVTVTTEKNQALVSV
ncbi:MAG: Multi-sensor hybrid histidine kinase [Parcubacteria group bacterium GW2011_GWA2_47_7]|nr:MAG: Multi-sensor hybrid histidine kinase [Parcubacteria group bacterium GW2011_GWA2_47_7]